MQDFDDPYAPPVTSPTQPKSYRKNWEVAGKGRRFANFLIDYVGLFLSAVILGIIVAMVGGDEGIARLEEIPDILLGIPISLCYYVFWEGFFARTPGKFLTGTRVIGEDGSPPSWGQVIGRTLCRYIPFEPLAYLGLERPWHDNIPKTYVILNRQTQQFDEEY